MNEPEHPQTPSWGQQPTGERSSWTGSGTTPAEPHSTGGALTPHSSQYHGHGRTVQAEHASMQPYSPTPYQQQGYASGGYGGGYVGVGSTRKPVSGVLVALAWVLAIFTLGYLLPWAVAVTRNRSNMGAIFVLNFFLGWSFIGWVVSLVMACQSESQTNVVVVNNHMPYHHG